MKWLFPYRIGRLEYLGRMVLFFPVLFGIVFLSNKIFTSAAPGTIFLYASLALHLAYFLPFIAAPRIRDTGASPWFCLVFLIYPISVLAAMLALFAPSNWWTERQKKRKAESSDLSEKEKGAVNNS